MENEETYKRKVHLITLYAVDYDGIGAEGVKDELENANYGNDCITPEVLTIETREVAWSDDHPINLRGTRKQALKYLFGRDYDAW
jgi:hypothetical protein